MTTRTDPSVIRALQSIEQVLDASHEIQFPWQRLFAYGIVIGIIPYWERATDFMSFGHIGLKNEPSLIAAIHLVFYFTLFGVVKRCVQVSEPAQVSSAHPLIEKGLQTQRVILGSMAVAVLGLTYVEQADLIFPFCLLFFAVMFHEYAKYTRGPLMSLSGLSFLLSIACFFGIKHWPVLDVWQMTNTVWALGFLATSIRISIGEKKHRA